MNALDDLRRGVGWPIRWLGLEPGRALANARPSGVVLRAARAEQRAYIQAAHPEPSGQVPRDDE